METYLTKPRAVLATEMKTVAKVDGPPGSNCFEYEGISFTHNSLPIVGGYIVKQGGTTKYMSAIQFHATYKPKDNG